MSFSLVSSQSKAAVAGDPITTTAINTTGADLIVISVTDIATQTAGTLSDSSSNTWTILNVTTTTNNRTRLFYCLNPTTNASHTFTYTWSGADRFPAMCVQAWSGAHDTSTLDQQAAGSGSSAVTSRQPGSVTPSEDNCLVVTACGFNAVNTLSINGSFTISHQVNFDSGDCFGNAMAYLVQTTAAAANPTWSWSSSCEGTAVGAVFLSSEGGGGGGGPPALVSKGLLLGVGI